MPISFACPKCQMPYTVGDDFAGRKANCQKCGQRMQVPTPRAHTLKPPPLPQPITPPPRPRRLSDDARDAHDDRRGRQKQLQIFMAVVGGGFVLLVGGIFLLVLVFGGSSDKKTTEVASSQPKTPPITPTSDTPKVLVPKTTPPKTKTPERPPEVEDPKPTKREPLRGEDVYQRLMQSSVFIVHPKGMGSGFVVDQTERLIVTNAHVVGKEATTLVLFPRYNKDGELLTDPKDYQRQHAVPGRVVEVDVRRDLAVIQVGRLPESTKAVTLASKPAQTGSTVYSVGGSGAESNLLWRLTKGTVRGRSERRLDSPQGEVSCMVLETDSPINPGDSGGPVMNEYGELVAVVSHFLRLQRQVSGNIDLVEVQRLVKQRTRE